MASPASSSITVAVPTFNGAAYLAETLQSILEQKEVPFDLIVSDDLSEDTTLDLVRAVAGDRARVVVNQSRLGLAGNWNQCVAMSRTPFISIVHQDDLLCPDHLAAHVEAFSQDSRIGLVCSASTVIDAMGRKVSSAVIETGGLGCADQVLAPGELAWNMVQGNPLRCSAVSIRVEAHAEVGGFDPSLRYVLDWEFWLRVSRRWKVAWLARPTVKVRWHAASETHRFKTGTADLDETQRLLDRLFTEDLAASPQLADSRRLANRRLSRAYLNRAHEALRGGQAELARLCLGKAVRLAPRVLGTCVAQPRLGIQMAALALTPQRAARWFSRVT